MSLGGRWEPREEIVERWSEEASRGDVFMPGPEDHGKQARKKWRHSPERQPQGQNKEAIVGGNPPGLDFKRELILTPEMQGGRRAAGQPAMSYPLAGT